MTQVCSCSNPDCIANGCVQLRTYRVNFPGIQYQPLPVSPFADGCSPVKHLTEEDVRRIIREEIDFVLNRNGKMKG